MPLVDVSVAAVRRRPSLIVGVVASLFFGLLTLVSGCAGPGREVTWLSDATLEHYRDRELHISNPVDSAPAQPRKSWKRPPRTITAPTEDEIRDLSLSDALKLALENNSVIRTRGGFLSPGNTVLSSPDRVASIWDPAIQESGVLFGGRGVTAALAAFDPEFTTTMIWRRNETPQNNSFMAGGIGSGGSLVGEMGDFTSMLRKQMGYGASLSVGHDWSYFGSNIPSGFNLYNSTYTGNVNLRYRQPLLAGSGTEFTQIAGPVTQQFRGLSGVSQGVVIARINNDLTLSQFEQSAINLVKDVEDQYWDLYLAYRKWDAAVMARNSAQKSWRDTKVILDGGGKEGFTNSDEPLARDRYYQTRAQSEAALAELYRTETALRRLLGLPVSDGTVLRPSDEPVTARFEPNWEASLVEALTHRVELRRQRWSLQSLSLQLKAAQSLIRPRLDLVGGYQVNALGDNLFSSDRSSPYSSGYRGLSHADHTGWNLGFEFTLPLGMRSANAQVKNLELRLAKSRAVLDAQESEISHELSDAVQQLAAHEAATRSNLNRRAAAQERVRQFEIEVFNAGTKTLDDLLRAQVSRADAEVAYYTSLVAYNQALANLHFRTGGLLAVNNVQLAESEWTPDAYRDALRRAWQRSHGVSADGLLEAQPTPFAEPGPLSQPESAIEVPTDQEPSPPSAANPPAGAPESTVSPVDDSPEIVPSTYQKLTDRFRTGNRRLRKTPTDAPTEDKPVEPELQEAAPQASKLSTTYRRMVDGLRERTRSRSGKSKDLPTPPAEVTESTVSPVDDSPKNVPSTYQKLTDRFRTGNRRLRKIPTDVPTEDKPVEPELQEAAPQASKLSTTYRRMVDSWRERTRSRSGKSKDLPTPPAEVTESTVSPVDDSPEIVPSTYQKLTDRFRTGNRRLRKTPTDVPTEDKPVEPELQEAAPQASKLSTTYRRMVDSWRERTRSRSGKSKDLPTPPAEGTESTVSPVDDSPEIVPSTYQKLTDRFRTGNRRLRKTPTDVPTEDKPVEPELQEAAPQASKLSTTYRRMVDSWRERTRSRSGKSKDLPTPPAEGTESTVSPVDDSPEIVPSTYQKLTDRFRTGNRRLRKIPTDVPTEDKPVEPELQEAAPQASKLSTTYRRMVDGLRERTRSRSGKSKDLPTTAAEGTESTVSPVDDNPEIVPSTYQKLTDRFRTGNRRLRKIPTDVPTEDKPVEPELQEAAPQASKLSTTYRRMVDGLRERTRSRSGKSKDLPTPPAEVTESTVSPVDDSPKNVPSTYQKLTDRFRTGNRRLRKIPTDVPTEDKPVEPELQEAAPQASKLSTTYRRMVDGLRDRTQRLKSTPKDLPARPAASTEATSTESETQEASPTASKLSGTYRKLTERLRDGTWRFHAKSPSTSAQDGSSEDQVTPSGDSKLLGTYENLVERLLAGKNRFQNRSIPASEDSPGRDTTGLPAVVKPPSRPIAPSSRQRLVYSIWKSKQAGETPIGVTSPPAKPRITQSSFSDDDTASPDTGSDEFQLPR